MAPFTLPSLFSKVFEYEPLETPTSIRLVTILPESNGLAEPTIAGADVIHCTLETVNLNDAPIYDALSYTWGSPFSAEEIKKARRYNAMHKWPVTINGTLVFITRNLYEALSRLRHSSYNTDDTEKEQEPSFGFEMENVEQRIEYNKTPLIKAAEQGVHLWVEQLLKSGADMRAQDQFGETALHYAAQNGHLECVRILVQAGADLEQRNKRNMTALDCCEDAKRRQYEEVLRILKTPVEQAAKVSEDPGGEIRPSRLWIDAICINQNDISEMSSQVQMMDRIYASARSSIVWLGVEDDSTSEAKDALHLLINFPRFFGMYKPNWSRSWHLSDKERESRRLTCGAKLVWLRDLLERSWFSRAWVIQEVLLARHVKVLCGKYVLPWKGFLLFAQLSLDIGHTGESSMRDYVRKTRDRPPSQRFNLGGQARLRFLHQSTAGSSLLSLLLLADHFRASDPRDKIFALLSLVGQDSTGKVITADYNKTTRDLFMQLAYDLIKCEGIFSTKEVEKEAPFREPLEGLSFLCWSHRSKENPLGIPSWTPDFSRIWSGVNERIFLKDFEASMSVPPVIEDLPHLGRIGLQGFKFDHIEVVAPRSNDPACRPGTCIDATDLGSCNCESKWRSTLTQWLKFASSLDRPYPSGHTLSQALWCTLMAGEDRCYELSSEDVHCKSRLFYKWFGEENGREREASIISIFGRLSHSVPYKFEDEWAREATITKKCKRRNLYKTRLGYLGLGRLEVEPGDEVWLFAGARTPFVVRRLDPDSGENVFQFKGETYVHGLMFGEGFKGREQDLVELQLA
ncbi:hypothetical protein IWZ00DRAFT_533904 [Phyllosticta capitalensis]